MGYAPAFWYKRDAVAEPDFTDELIARIRALSRPMDPVPTELSSRLTRMRRLGAVLFDVYGTLFVSGSGDIGEVAGAQNQAALAEALRAAGLAGDLEKAAAAGSQALSARLAAAQEARRREGIEYPEVEIQSVWREVLADLGQQGLIHGEISRGAAERVAVEYECRVNPVWPMPGLRDLLEHLRAKGLVLGLVSNAQFYTPLLFNALLGHSPEGLGFDPFLCIWSCALREAKPSARLLERALTVLEERHGVPPRRTLCVGNDLLNDIRPAAQCGCRTALFAGDARSVRLRKDDERCAGLEPDAVVTDLRELVELVG